MKQKYNTVSELNIQENNPIIQLNYVELKALVRNCMGISHNGDFVTYFFNDYRGLTASVVTKEAWQEAMKESDESEYFNYEGGKRSLWRRIWHY